MNEIPMYIDLGPNKTLNRVGDKTVSIRITGAEKWHLTIVLSCTANGDRHLPMIIFKRKTEPKVKTPTGFVVTANGKGWRYELLMKIFITDIWMKKVGEVPPHHGLLPFYYTDMVMRALHACHHPRCTSILQPLDVSINKPCWESTGPVVTRQTIKPPKSLNHQLHNLSRRHRLGGSGLHRTKAETIINSESLLSVWHQ